MGAADDLHEAIFGFCPNKPGTAYERLAAVALAELGWVNVEHQTTLRPEGRRAAQCLDVTATDPEGKVRRLLVECKDWNRDVGKATLDVVIGIREQTGVDAAMVVTTKGFSAGAIDVAVDEDVAMVLLREVRPDEHFVLGYTLELSISVPTFSAVQLLVPEDADVTEGQVGNMSTDDHFYLGDNSQAETLGELFEAHSTSSAGDEGHVPHEVRFDEMRFAAPDGGRRIPIIGVRWTETLQTSSPSRVSSTETGKPCLVVEQIDGNGEPQRARLLVDRHLNAWEIDTAGKVVERGALA